MTAAQLSSSRRLPIMILVALALAALIATVGTRSADGQVGGVGNGTADWNGWTFDYGVESGFDGLRLSNVKYDGDLIANRMSLPVMNVYYENNGCGPYADRLGGTIQGTFINEFNQEGERWLEVAIEDHIGAYVIYQSFYFSESGKVDAHMFSKGLQCNLYHEHLPFWLMDFDLMGSEGDEVLRRRADGTLEPLTSEFDRDATDAANHEWYVRDSATGKTLRIDFDTGTYNQGGTIVPETEYVNNRVYGRQYNSDELTWSGGARRTVPHNNGQAISDLVLWYTGFMPHSAEEGPNLWHSTGVRITPVDDPLTEPPGNGECAGLSQEAEQAALSGSMRRVASGSASGGFYVDSPEGSGNHGSAGNNKAEHCFIVDQSGSYQLRAVVDGPSGTSDSFFVTVNGQSYLWDVRSGQGFVTDNLSDRGGADPVLLNLSPGEHTVGIHVREDGTRIDSLELVRVGDGGGGGNCGAMSQEAESATLIGTMVRVNSGSASGGAYIEAPEGSGNSGSAGGNQARFCFDVPTSGNYKMVAKVQGVSGTSDSFFVSAGGDTYLWDVTNSGGFATDEVSDRNGDNPAVVYLAAGEQNIGIHVREDGTRLDTLSLVAVGGGGGGGGDCGPMTQEAEDGQLFGRMTSVASGSASGGAYIEVPEGSGNSGSVGSSSKAVFCFNVPSNGTYRISTKVQGMSGASDSFFVELDGNTALWDVSTTAGFVTDNVSDRITGDNPVLYNLGAGEHTVTVYLREDGTRLDTLSLIAQ